MEIRDIAARCLRDESEALLGLIPLLNGNFDGAVNCATLGAGSIGSCGSIYVETAADGDRRGTIILDDNNVTCTTYTPICATGYEADDVADFKKASLVIKQQAKGQVTAADAEGKFAMNSVEIDSTGQLDLFGHCNTLVNYEYDTSVTLGADNVLGNDGSTGLILSVVFVLVIFVLTMIFKYGAELQKEHDETV